jgi:hypothetical protein
VITKKADTRTLSGSRGSQWGEVAARLGGEGEGELVVQVEGDAGRDGVEDDVVGHGRALLDRLVPLVLRHTARASAPTCIDKHRTAV